MTPHEKALNGILGDMDDMESKRIFSPEEGKGMSITISVNPGGGDSSDTEYPEGHDAEMCKGGCAYHLGGVVGGGDNGSGKVERGIIDGLSVTDGEGMSKGGIVDAPQEDPGEISLPKFLRKKKNVNG